MFSFKLYFHVFAEPPKPDLPFGARSISSWTLLDFIVGNTVSLEQRDQKYEFAGKIFSKCLYDR